MIEIRGLKKSYGSKHVLDGIDLTIPDGSKFGLIGINGAGKSTLLRLMADVLRPDEGSICVDGERITGNAKKRGEIFFLPDDPYYAPGTTVKTLIELYSTFYDFDRETFDRFASAFSLQLSTPVKNFSKGMKRQAFIALALACRPRYLLLDEAFDGLDPLARLEFKRGIIEQEQCTVVISSHSLRELEDICNGFALLDGGRILDSGDIQSALDQVHKFQIALRREVVREDIPFECISFEAEGRVAKFLFRGDRDEAVRKLEALDPLLIEEIPVDFEELFLCEVKGRGYLA